MEKSSFLLFTFAFLLCFTLSTGAGTFLYETGTSSELINSRPAGKVSVEGSRRWCIAKPSSSDIQLELNIEYVCTGGNPPIDCSIIQLEGACNNPTNKVSYASVVMNLYFQATGKQQHACNFNSSGLVIYYDPSVGKCVYPAN